MAIVNSVTTTKRSQPAYDAATIKIAGPTEASMEIYMLNLYSKRSLINLTNSCKQFSCICDVNILLFNDIIT